MKVAVLGAGAIGCWLAGALAEAGASVSIVARGASLQALQTHGLRVWQGETLKQYSLPAGCGVELGPQDFVIIATKAQDVAAALPELQPMLGVHTAVVSALNGLPWWFTQRFAGPLDNQVLQAVDPQGALAAALDASRAIGAVVHASASRVGPGEVRVGKVDKLIFGEPSGASSPRLEWLVQQFTRAGITTLSSDNIRREVWAKLWGNMNMNPLSALTRATTGRLLDDPDLQQLALHMMEEMATCGARIGLPFSMSAAERMAVTRKLGDFKTSMLQDVESGGALEYLPQLGAVVEVARRLDVPAPYCSAVLGLIRQLANSLAA